MTDCICIDVAALGTQRHLIVDDGFAWGDSVPDDSWHLTGTIKLHSDRCCDTLFRLNGVIVDLKPPQRFVNAMSHVLSNDLPVPWAKVMPARDHRAFVKRVTAIVVDSMATISKKYYVNTWVPESGVLRSLLPARIDTQLFNVNMAAVSNVSTLETFRPKSNGYTRPITYDRFGSRTGRMTVADGPDILTLKKELRRIIIPSDPYGCIAIVDFSALEARIVLYEACRTCEAADIYAMISDVVFKSAIPRDIVKGAVISMLYGQGATALGERLGIAGAELDEFMDAVRSFFHFDDLRRRIEDEYTHLGHITNRYGRRIRIDATHKALINSYVQSTGVDVSLLGFSQLIEMLCKRPGVRPLFVLHDGLVLDVARDRVDEVKKISSVIVPGYVQHFGLHCDVISDPK